jgi:hypothetical protein
MSRADDYPDEEWIAILASRELRYPSTMDINKMLNDLRMELEQVSEAIVVLERLSLGQGKRRGRPPKWMTEVKPLGRAATANSPRSPVCPSKEGIMSPAVSCPDLGACEPMLPYGSYNQIKIVAGYEAYMEKLESRV